MTTELAVIIPSWFSSKAEETLAEADALTAAEVDWHIIHNPKEPFGCLSAMQLGAEQTSANYLCFAHDDTHLLEKDWDLKLVEFFETHPKCGLVGLGGALKFGHPWIYKTPYQLMQLIRYDFRSNMKDWAVHGIKSEIAERVAFVDGFFMAFRRAAFEEMGQWKRLKEYGLPEFHGYDMTASIEMARLGWEVWMTPLRCHHEGGRTSTTDQYTEFVRKEGFKDGQELFERAHRVAYERGRGVLPIWV